MCGGGIQWLTQWPEERMGQDPERSAEYRACPGSGVLLSHLHPRMTPRGPSIPRASVLRMAGWGKKIFNCHWCSLSPPWPEVPLMKIQGSYLSRGLAGCGTTVLAPVTTPAALLKWLSSEMFLREVISMPTWSTFVLSCSRKGPFTEWLLSLTTWYPGRVNSFHRGKRFTPVGSGQAMPGL